MIDWKEIYKKIEVTGAFIEGGCKPTLEEEKKILEQRARDLARKESFSETDAVIEVVVFRLAQERFALESRFIKEVFFLDRYTPLPGVPSFVFGLINVRGQIYSVLDLKKYFEMPEDSPDELSRILILDDEEMRCGILADEIVGVNDIKESQLTLPSIPVSGVRKDFIRGISSKKNIVVLDGAMILADEELIIQ